MLRIKGHIVEVNYLEELEPFTDRLYRNSIRGNKLLACSPFRHESRPSFAINLDDGTWIDSGASDDNMRKGNFITLLAFFRNESYNDTAEHLFEKYIHILDDIDGIKLELSLSLDAPEVAVLGKEKYENVIGIHTDYLESRGITKEIQSYFETGKGVNSGCVALPWHDKYGRIINIKYRSIKGKDFWFSSGGQPIKNHVYGLFAIKEQGIKTVWIVESEIDCLYLWSCGIPSIALGGGSISDEQCKLIRSSGIEKMVIATDNDVVGHRVAKVLTDEFIGSYLIDRLIFPEGKKDVNEISKHDIIRCTTIPCTLQIWH